MYLDTNSNPDYLKRVNIKIDFLIHIFLNIPSHIVVLFTFKNLI